MRDLVRLSEQELSELSTAQRLRMFIAIGISTACGIISLQGMAALFTDATVVPLPGMQHLAGQIGWAMALAGMLVAVTFLVRGVVKRRLQWAIALSLLIHFLLCLSMTTVNFQGPHTTPAHPADFFDLPREEFSLPDYAGTDVPDAESIWRKPTDTQTPEQKAEPTRPDVEMADSEKQESVELKELMIAEAAPTPERQEKVDLAAESAESMERASSSGNLPESTVVSEPEVQTAASSESELKAQVEQEKPVAEMPASEREGESVASAESAIKAAPTELRREELVSTPEDVAASEPSRTVSDVQAATTVVESPEIAAADSLAATEFQEQRTEVSRRQASAVSAAGEPEPSEDLFSNPATISRVTPQRSGQITDANAEAPTDGGSVAMARSDAGNENADASESMAESTAVTSPAGVSVSPLRESASANAGRRSSAASVSATAGRSGSASSTLPGGGEPAVEAVRSARAARSSSVGGQPTLGESGELPTELSQGSGRKANAVGTVITESSDGSISNRNLTQIDGSGSSSRGTKGTTSGEKLIAGPASTSVGRRSSSLPSTLPSTLASIGGAKSPGSPAGLLNSPNSPSSPSTVARVPGLARPSAVSGSGGSGSSASGTEPSAKLNANDGFSGAASPRVAMTRAPGSIGGLPEGAAEAEQSGTLVFSGPQAASGAPGISGPRIGAIPRRSVGLPGRAGPSGSGANSSTTGNDVQPARISATTARNGVGNDRPAIASTDTLSGLVKRSSTGGGSVPEARIPESLSMRSTDARREAARALGGSEASEDAVERGLQWLVKNQYPDGHWSIDDFPGEPSEELVEGSFKSDSAATGLALLAYLGAGYTHQSGKYQQTVERGMKWMLAAQKPNGDLFSDETKFVWFYSHGIASIALCEAYGLTRDPALKEPAQKAIDFIVESQHPDFGGWRYLPKYESDTSVSGWQLMALKSGEMAGLNVPKNAYGKVSTWLDSVRSKSSMGQFSYHPSRPASPAMTAEGLLMRQYLGAKRDDAELIAGANFLRTRLPDFGQRDAYYWYYATQVMFHMQGEHWSEWNRSLRDLLVTTQNKQESVAGSWDPVRPTPEKWANGGGRHYLTCLNLLMLEVYYRHLPLYLELEKQ